MNNVINADRSRERKLLWQLSRDYIYNEVYHHAYIFINDSEEEQIPIDN